MPGYAVETISSLPFGILIGGPLTAAIDAQAQGAKATIDFIQQVGFVPPNDDADMLFLDDEDVNQKKLTEGDFGDVRMITFTFDSVDLGGEAAKAQLTVPLLTVVPIPMLEINEMTIDFTAKISEAIMATRKDEDARRKEGSATSSGGWGPVSGSLKGSYSSTHTSTSERASKYQTELTMSVHVRATSESMPKGLGRVLDILQAAIKSAPAVAPDN